MATDPEYKSKIDRAVLEGGKFVEGPEDTWTAAEDGAEVVLWHEYPEPVPPLEGNRQPHSLKQGDTITITAGPNGLNVKIKPAGP